MFFAFRRIAQADVLNKGKGSGQLLSSIFHSYKGNDSPSRGSSLPSLPWEATRPRMFPVWVSSAIVPATLALLHGVFEPLTFTLEALLCFLLLTLSCRADEIGDLDHGMDNEFRLGPHRPLQRREITQEQMVKACVVLGTVSALCGLGLVTWSCIRIPIAQWVPALFVAIGLVAIICAYTCTMGKRPYRYRGWGDVSAYFFFGPVACAGGFWLYGHMLDWSVMLPAPSIGILLVVTINLQTGISKTMKRTASVRRLSA